MKNMKKRTAGSSVFVAVLLVFLTGCSGIMHATKDKKTADSAASIVLTEERFAMILSNETSVYDDRVAEGFAEIMEKANRNYVIERPKESSVQEQQKLIRKLVNEHISGIAIAPNDADALAGELEEALENGIDVCSFDKPASPKTRNLHVNPAGNVQIASTLLDAVLDLAGGSGQWAILTASSTEERQNGWIASMRETMKDDAYKDLELLEIAYGNDVYQTSYDQTRALLLNYPDLRVILSTSTTGLLAACNAVADFETKSAVRLTGFGLPSEMDGLVGDDEICPYFFLRNPIDVGRLAAYVSIALREDVVTGAIGESFRADDMGEFTVTEAADSGTEVIVGSPYRFDERNIQSWVDVF